MSAIEHGVLRYLQKPFDIDTFANVVCDAVNHRSGTPDFARELERFERAMASMFMAYQPIIRWSTRETFAFEALVRCSAPDVRGPQELIELAERTNQLSLLGSAIRDRVAADAAGLADDVLLFVNLHPADLDDSCLFELEAPLSKLSGRVVLEITERANVSNLTGLPESINALRRMGFRLAVDDLGAGYAGLTTVAQVHPEFVKLDASLVRNLERSAAQQVVVSAVLDLAGHLNSEVIAEAIETESERNVLKTLGVDCMQGYYFARPSPPFAKVADTAFRESQRAA
jgi:EAL domain-containing protein (putative c-di-GMP-specific phosphodiesterase class I)